MPINALCIYCGSSVGALPDYALAARDVGKLLAQQGITLVYGGGNVGLMGAVADAALKAGGKVIGVIPHALAAKELAHLRLTELHRVESMHERKTLMARLSDGFVALPGGIGTLEEIFEVFTWTQLGFQTKPCAFLNVAGYYDELLAFLDKAVEQRFLRREHLDSLMVDTDMERLLKRMTAWEHVAPDKWLERVARGLEET
jgi:uncharacterized protein (TIGR00730 family)